MDDFVKNVARASTLEGDPTWAQAWRKNQETDPVVIAYRPTEKERAVIGEAEAVAERARVELEKAQADLHRLRLQGGAIAERGGMAGASGTDFGRADRQALADMDRLRGQVGEAIERVAERTKAFERAMGAATTAKMTAQENGRQRSLALSVKR